MRACQRCGARDDATVVSYFNTQTICLDCATKERAHPKFIEARDAECAAVERGDLNFPGIGCPPELLR